MKCWSLSNKGGKSSKYKIAENQWIMSIRDWMKMFEQQKDQIKIIQMVRYHSSQYIRQKCGSWYHKGAIAQNSKLPKIDKVCS